MKSTESSEADNRQGKATLNVPLELVEHSSRQGVVKPLKVLLALKFVYGGQVRLSEINLAAVGSIAGMKDNRTIKRHVDAAMQRDWIGTDKRWLFIRGFERVRELEGINSRTAVEVTPGQVGHIVEYCLPAKIQSRAKAKRHARKKAGATQTPEPYSSLDGNDTPFFDTSASCTLIGEWYGCSASTASRMKATAKANGYTKVKHRYRELAVHKRYFADVTDIIPSNRLTIISGQVCVRLTDLFYPAEYRFKTRASL